MLKHHFNSLLTKVKSVIQNKKMVLAIISVVAVGFLIHTILVPSITQNHSSELVRQKHELLSAVDTTLGTPRDGRDPAFQGQNSLASAASKPEGPGQRTDTPAANITGDHDHHVDPSSVLRSSKQSGTLSSGCIVGYGKSGEQCLPTPGDNKTVSCDYVRKYFPHGVSVTGDDSLHLDKNHDKVACDHDE